MVISPVGLAVCWPSTVAVVPILGVSVKVTVCPSSSMSVWEVTSSSPMYKVSKTTTAFPVNAEASKMNSTSMVPFGSAGVNVASEVTWVCSSPSPISRGSPVSLSIRTPVSLYSWPTVRPLYSTVSVMVICSAGTAVFSPSMVAVVPMVGLPKFTVCPSSLMSAWDATTFSP